MNWTARRRRFRQILAGNDCVTPATVFNPLSARMVEELGGQVGMYADKEEEKDIVRFLSKSKFKHSDCLQDGGSAQYDYRTL